MAASLASQPSTTSSTARRLLLATSRSPVCRSTATQTSRRNSDGVTDNSGSRWRRDGRTCLPSALLTTSDCNLSSAAVKSRHETSPLGACRFCRRRRSAPATGRDDLERHRRSAPLGNYRIQLRSTPSRSLSIRGGLTASLHDSSAEENYRFSPNIGPALWARQYAKPHYLQR